MSMHRRKGFSEEVVRKSWEPTPAEDVRQRDLGLHERQALPHAHARAVPKRHPLALHLAVLGILRRPLHPALWHICLWISVDLGAVMKRQYGHLHWAKAFAMQHFDETSMAVRSHLLSSACPQKICTYEGRVLGGLGRVYAAAITHLSL